MFPECCFPGRLTTPRTAESPVGCVKLEATLPSPQGLRPKSVTATGIRSEIMVLEDNESAFYLEDYAV